MNSLLLLFLLIITYLLAYNLYGRFLSGRIFELVKNGDVPSRKLMDGIDYVPTKKEIIFGHHFTSIAGLGPIVGPAIAIIWGWVPAILWVVFGAILMGAVHDFGSLVVSLRNEGKSIGELTGSLITPRARILFLLIIFFELWIVIAIFAMIMGVLFKLYPTSVFPVWMEIPIAVMVGYLAYRKGKNIFWLSILAIILMYATVIIGAYFPLKLPSIEAWLVILFVYSYIASILPVWLLLQPRDFINSHELAVVMFLLFLGVMVAHPSIVAPSCNPSPPGAPPILPFIFVIIACGAISGFHSLVSSGTSSKQVEREEDALFVGYGGMLLESVLSVLVIIAIAAGLGMGYHFKGRFLTGREAWFAHYSDWVAASGLGAKLSAFIEGSSNLLAALKIPRAIAVTIMGVFIVSFAGTTLDTATRIQRYVVGEFSGIKNRYLTTLIAVGASALLAFSQKGGKGALILWPLFGTVNQLLAGLSLLVITIYLAYRRKPLYFTGIPMLFMIGMTGWAMVKNILKFHAEKNMLLFTVGVCIFLLELWMIFETILVLRRIKGGETGGDIS